jgi:hypothetical protein
MSKLTPCPTPFLSAFAKFATVLARLHAVACSLVDAKHEDSTNPFIIKKNPSLSPVHFFTRSTVFEHLLLWQFQAIGGLRGRLRGQSNWQVTSGFRD